MFKVDTEKARQAMQEWGFAFTILWAPLLLGFMSGFKIGEVVVLPNKEAVVGFMVGTLGAASLGFLKALFWYVTGTKVNK